MKSNMPKNCIKKRKKLPKTNRTEMKYEIITRSDLLLSLEQCLNSKRMCVFLKLSIGTLSRTSSFQRGAWLWKYTTDLYSISASSSSTRQMHPYETKNRDWFCFHNVFLFDFFVLNCLKHLIHNTNWNKTHTGYMYFKFIIIIIQKDDKYSASKTEIMDLKNKEKKMFLIINAIVPNSWTFKTEYFIHIDIPNIW